MVAPGKGSALLSVLLLGVDAGWGWHASEQCREALGAREAPIEVELDGPRVGLGGWAPQQAQGER